MTEHGAQRQQPAPSVLGEQIEGLAHEPVCAGDDEAQREAVQQCDDQRPVARRSHVREGLDRGRREPPTTRPPEHAGRTARAG